MPRHVWTQETMNMLSPKLIQSDNENYIISKWSVIVLRQSVFFICFQCKQNVSDANELYFYLVQIPPATKKIFRKTTDKAPHLAHQTNLYIFISTAFSSVTSVWKLIHNYPTSIKSLVQRNVCQGFLQLNSLSTYSLFDTSQTLVLAFQGSMGEINRNNWLNTEKRLNGSMRAASCSGALSLISQSLTNPLCLCPLQLLIPQSRFSSFCLAVILPPCWTYYSISLLYTR